jgi:gliding motility-associated transport system ATP-binding protein
MVGRSPLIEVQGLTKYFGERPAISEVTFSVPRGQVLGFLGPNGAGKSTTMRILTGYLSASAGTASIAGYDVFDHSLEVRRRVGYLPELAPLYSEMRVEPYLALMCKLRGVPPSRRGSRIDYVLTACGLEDRRREVIGHLSKGLRQRVGLAQAVVHDPDVLILDEPTVGLDPAQTRETRSLIVELGRQHTVILSSHILPEVSATCDRVVIINQGRLVADDTPKNLGRRLSQGRAQQVEAVVRGGPADVVQRLRQLPGVEQVELSDLDDGERRLLVTGQADDLEDAVAKAVIGAGMGLRELRSRALTLEDVFLELTMEEAS